MEKLNIFPTATSLSGMTSIKNILVAISDEYFSLYLSDLNRSVVYEIEPRINQNLSMLTYKDRKIHKPDFESVSKIQIHGKDFLHLMPSFSKKNRNEIYLIEVCEVGNGDELMNFGKVIKIQNSFLYNNLKKNIESVNIEGHFISNGSLIALNRGNNHHSSALIVIDDYQKQLEKYMVTEDLQELNEFNLKIFTVDLGSLESHNIHWTEACPLNAREFLFLASVEDTGNAIDDGKVLGSFIGKYDLLSRQVLTLKKIFEHEKTEGMATINDNIVLCTDPDSEILYSQCYIEKLGLVVG